PGRRLNERLEHSLQIEGRATDDLEYVSSGSLLLERFAQFTEQPRILDGDDGLIGKVLYQVNLLVSKRTNLLAINVYGTDHFALIEHRDKKGGSSIPEFDASDA